MFYQNQCDFNSCLYNIIYVQSSQISQKSEKKVLLSKDYCKIIETDCKLHFVDC